MQFWAITLALQLAAGARAHPHESYSLDIRSGLVKRDRCGEGFGLCPTGECCSEAGYCGTDKDYCKGPQCQIDYSSGNCDADHPPAGTSTLNVPRPLVGNVPYGTVLRSCTQPGVVALTYDDGPSYYTSDLLDILEQNSVLATFFIVGNGNGRGMISDPSTPWPAVLKRMHSAGHQIGSHTWTHQNLESSDDFLRETQIVYNEMAFRDLFGFFPAHLRPPYDASDAGINGCLDLVTGLGYHVVDFDLDTKDYLNDSPLHIQASKDIFAAALAGSDPNEDSFLVLVHDTHEQTVYNLTQYMITSLQDAGYRAVTLGECLGDASENWYRDVSGPSSSSTADSGGCTAPPPPITTTTTSSNASPTGPTGTVSAAGGEPTGLTISPDGTCGGTNGFTCTGAPQGGCCSVYGFCGSTSGYCDGGCQPEFGTCNTISGIVVSANGICGPAVSQTCAGSTYGSCCSKYGFCGSTTAYCGTGCQSVFGVCG